MSDRKPPLDYATPPDPKPWPTWLALLWPLIVINIWGCTFFSVAFTVLGIVNVYHRVPGLGVNEQDPGFIHWTNTSWIISNALLAAIFVPLTVCHWRWRRRNRKP